MKLSEELEMIHDSGDCGMALDGLSTKAANIEGHIEKLEIKLVESLNEQTAFINHHNKQIGQWHALAAALYQACGAYGMPERVLDAISAAQCGEPFEHLIDGILPCYPDAQPAQVHEIANGFRQLPDVSTPTPMPPVKPPRSARVPDGWKLVPVDPTQEMLEVGSDSWDSRYPTSNECYAAMLAASPAPEVE